jgi:hypothetical protein
MSAFTNRSLVAALIATAVISTLAFVASVLANPVAESPDGGGPLVLSFTKWLTTDPSLLPALMAGTVKGDVVGTFAGEALVIQTTRSGDITRLEATYEVQAGDRSFKALMQGGQNNQAGTALLDGVILGGWHTGSRVHVEYHVVTNCGQPGAFNNTCFTGTITIDPTPGS